MVVQAQDQHVVHLIQPLWSATIPRLMTAAMERMSGGEMGILEVATAEEGLAGPQTESQEDPSPWRCWVFVPFLRMAAHVNSAVRKLGIMTMMALEEEVIKGMAGDHKGCQFVIQMMEGLDHDKLSAEVKGPHQSPTRRHPEEPVSDSGTPWSKSNLVGQGGEFLSRVLSQMTPVKAIAFVHAYLTMVLTKVDRLGAAVLLLAMINSGLELWEEQHRGRNWGVEEDPPVSLDTLLLASCGTARRGFLP